MPALKLPIYVLVSGTELGFVWLKRPDTGASLLPLFTSLEYAVLYLRRSPIAACILALGDKTVARMHFDALATKTRGTDFDLIIDPVDQKPGEVMLMPYTALVEALA